MYQLAHRGLSDLYPENTMSAFKAAIEEPFDGIETDIQMTKDGELILLHDYMINRTSNGRGYVRDYTYEELLHFNFGVNFNRLDKIPTLKELLVLIKESGKIANLEIKADVYPETVRKTVELVKTFDMDDQIYYSSTDLSKMLEVKQMLPDAYCAIITDHNYTICKQDVYHNPIEGIHSRYNYLSVKELNQYKKDNIKVGAWTITTEEQFNYFKQNDILFAFTNHYYK